MNRRLFRLRRVGVAAIAGVTALGAAAIVGEGVAGAVATNSVSFTTSSSVEGAASTWNIGATTSSTLTGGTSTVSVAFPSNFGTSGTVTANFAAPCSTSAAGSVTGSVATFTIPAACTVGPGTAITFTVTGFTNPTTAGPYTASTTGSATTGFYVYSSGDPTHVASTTGTGFTFTTAVPARTSAPTVTATSTTPTTSIGTTPAAGAAGAPITISLNGTSDAGDVIMLNLGCAAAPGATQAFLSATATSSAPSAGVTVSESSNNACGSSVKNVLSLTLSAAVNQTITVTPTYALSNVPSGALSLSGTYTTTTYPAVSFAVPSDLTVTNVSVTPTSFTVVPPGSGDAAIGNLTITMPSNSAVTAGDFVCVNFASSTGITWDTIGGNPTVTQTNGASNATLGGITSTATTTTAATPNGKTQDYSLAFQTGKQSTLNAPEYTLSGLHVDVPTGTTNGTQTFSVGYSGTAAGCDVSPPPNQLITGLEAFAVGSAPAGPIYGQTAEGTAAAEFTHEFVSAHGTTVSCTDGYSAVLATAADPYDALSASYLEGILGTGVLITPPTTDGTIDANTLNALKMGGVQKVYIVGGPKAVTPQEIATLRSTPAYNCGGLAPTGAKLDVIPAATTGATAVDTAVLIANYLTINGQGGGATFNQDLRNVYASASTYNQTTGNASSAAPAAASGTAIVLSSTDWQDADAIAGVAYKYHIPVILTSATALSTQASTELSKLGFNQVIVAGGQLAVTPAVVTAIQAISVNVNGVTTPISVIRIAGQDATQTSADIAMFEGKILGWSNTNLLVAQGTTQGTGWGDSLAAAPLSGNHTNGVLLTAGPIKPLPSSLTSVLSSAGTPSAGLGGGITTGIQVLGGPLAVTTSQITQMNSALGH